MKKSVYKIITIAAVCILIAVCIFIGADILKSRQISINQSQGALEYMSENCAYEFQAIFDNGELLVNDVAVILEKNIVVGDYLVADEISDCREMIYEVTGNSKYPISLYFTFNPEYFREDIWFVKGLDGNIRDISADDELIDEWLIEWRKDNSEFSDFYWNAIEKGEVWYESVYDPETKWDVVSYVRAVYDKNHVLIGIVGADIYLGDISEKLLSIDELTGGVSAVINNEGQLITGSEDYKDKMENEAYIHATASMGDLWTVIITQPMKNVLGKTYEMIFVTIIIGVILLIGLFGMIVIVYNHHGKPIITKFEEKDIMMFNQARQAQMGEMVGNIAHQLKQPLNGVNMALSNLREEHGDSVENREDFEFRIDRIKARIGNMADTVDDLMMFLKPQKDEKSFSVIENIKNVLSLMEERIKLYSVNVEISGEDFRITGYENEFSQCIFNIIDNAIYEMMKNDEERTILIKVDKKDFYGEIQIENTGSVIETEALDKLFDLYYTTKGNEGTGIGLYLTKTIIEMHFAGTISCRNTDVGVCFEICIPLNESEKYKNA